jgi:hypothetical protein
MTSEVVKRRAWDNAGVGIRRTKRGKEYARPQEVGAVYPLTHNGDDFVAIFLGKHDIFRRGRKVMMFARKLPDEEYQLYSSRNGQILWHTEGDDGPEWLAGISVCSEGKASDENREGITRRFGDKFRELELVGGAA